MYGYTFDTESGRREQQDVLRYSAYDCWIKSKKTYRDKYYLGKSFQTAETAFGHEGHKRLESGEVILPGIPMYDMKERDHIAVVPGTDIKIGGRLDSLDTTGRRLLDYKFSHRNKDGKAPWDKKRVARHGQLVFYSLLVKLKYDRVHPWVKLVWIETEQKENSVVYNGHKFITGKPSLSLTGRYHVFNRRVTNKEREELLERIKIVAEEIREDFKKYKNEQRRLEQSDERIGEAFSQEEPENAGTLSGDGQEGG